MKHKQRLIPAFLVTILLIGSCGCNYETGANSEKKNPQNTGGDIVLSERQTQILLEQGLPTEYDELGKTQQAAIVAIEKLLNYLDEKYMIDFSYLGYNPAGVLENEELAAYPTDGDKLLDVVKVTVNSKCEIEDNYMDIATRSVYNSVVIGYIKQTYGEKEFFVHTSINTSRIDHLPIKAEDVSGNVGASCLVFFDTESTDESKFEEFALSFKDWMKDNKYYGSHQLFLLESGLVKYLSDYNYSDYFRAGKCIRRINCTISNNGTADLQELEVFE